jgi:preprotein translocase subunit SecD
VSRATSRRTVLSLVLLAATGVARASGAVAQGEVADTGGVVIVLRPDLAAARAAGTLAADQPDDAALQEVAGVLERRAEILFEEHSVRVVPVGDALEVGVAGAVGAAEAARAVAALVRPGRLGVWIQATDGDGIDLAAEAARLDAWLATHPGARVVAFNAVAPADGGPLAPAEGTPGLRWSVAEPTWEEDARTERERAVPLLVPADTAWRFGTADLADVYPSPGVSGDPAIGFELVKGRKHDFGAFTEAHVGRVMAIEIDGVCDSLAMIGEKLSGRGIILVGDTAAEVRDTIAVLRGGELPMPVEVVEVR